MKELSNVMQKFTLFSCIKEKKLYNDYNECKKSDMQCKRLKLTILFQDLKYANQNLWWREINAIRVIWFNANITSMFVSNAREKERSKFLSIK